MESRSLHKAREMLDVLEQTIGEPGDLSTTLQHIAQTAQIFFAADNCVIFAINPITNRFITSLTLVGNVLKEDISYEQPSPTGIAQQVLRQGILVIEDLDKTPEYGSTFTHSEGIRSFVVLPLRMKYRQKPLGVLYINFKQSQQFSSYDYELFQFFVDQASFILQETWLLRRYQEVAHIGQEINHELSKVDILFQKLQKHVSSILDTSYAFLLAVYQPQTSTLDLYLEDEGQSITKEKDPLEGASHYAISTQKTLFIRQMSKEAEYLPFQPVKINTGSKDKEALIFVPLTFREVSLGVLSIQHPQPNAYDHEDLFILQLLANHIALALHNMRLYNSLNQLNETGQILTQQLESEQTLQATVDKIRDATQADIIILYAYEPTLQRFMLPPRIAGTLYDPTIHAMYPSRSDDIAALMLHHAEPIFAKEGNFLYTELQNDGHIRRGNFQEREQIRSTAAVPLQVGNEVVGVLFVNFRQQQRFDASQKLFIEGLAHYAAIAIKNAQIFGSLSLRRIRELEILQNIDRELNRNLKLESVLNTLLKLANEQVPAEEASILLFDERKHALIIRATLGPHAQARQALSIPVEETKGITRWVLKHKRPARVDNVHLDPQWLDLYIESGADTVSELDVPLLNGEEVIGVLNFESKKEGAFHQEDEHFLLTLAGQAVLAIKNAQAYEREKRLAEESQVLNEISKEITSQLDSIHIFGLILEKALQLTHSHMGNLMLYDPHQNDLWMAAERGVAKDKKGLRHSLDQGVVGYVARNKQLLNVDLSQPPWNEIYLDYIPGTRSELAVPMLAGYELRGVLNVESLLSNNFTESDEHLLRGLADLAVIALQNAQAYEREKRFTVEAQVLNEISKEITSQLDSAHIFGLILEKALELTHSTLGSLHLFEPALNELIMVAERGVAESKKGKHQKPGEGVVGYVAMHKQSQNIKDVKQYPWRDIYIEFFSGVRSELTVPMLAGGELRGVLNVESFVLNNFTERDERLLQGLADLAVVALQNAEHYEKAEREAQHFELLYKASQELGKITDWAELEQAYDVVLHLAEEQSKSQVVIRRYNDDTQELVLIRASQHQPLPPSTCMKLDEGINRQVAREQRTIVIYDTYNLPSDVIAAQLSDPTTRSLLITPILFKDRYYGNLALGHEKVGYFQPTDGNFFAGLAHQLASTIYRLETAQARQEFEKLAISAEEMSSIGQSAYEVTHRLGNDLGLVNFYVSDIQAELGKLGVTNSFLSEKMQDIVQSVQAVLTFSEDLRKDLAKMGDNEETAGELITLPPRELLIEALATSSLPPTIHTALEIDEPIATVKVFHSLVVDILRNIVTNARQAMPDGGKLTLRTYNAGRFVALEVTDTGIGIPPKKLPQVFDLFFSTRGSSGFGLWSARRNALKNRGDLRVASQPGQGTTFTLLLPKADNGIL